MSENSRGKCDSALAKVDPALTSARSAATRCRSSSRSLSSARAVNARSSCRPEPTSPAIWRVQTVSRVSLKTRRPQRETAAPRPGPPASTGDTCNGMRDWARSWPRAALAVSASSRPRRVCPWASRASKEYAGMRPLSRRSPAARGAASSGRLRLPQPEPLQLARFGAGQARHELDLARVLVRGDGGLHVLLQCTHHGRPRFVPGLEHAERLDDHPALLVGLADDAALGDRWMAQQRILDFGAADVVAGGDDHVVGAR